VPFGVESFVTRLLPGKLLAKIQEILPVVCESRSLILKVRIDLGCYGTNYEQDIWTLDRKSERLESYVIS
jgi:hypothetical protein